MGRTTRVRVLSKPLVASLTRAQAVMACAVSMFYSAAAMLAAGQTLTDAQVGTLNAVTDMLGLGQVLGCAPAAAAPDPKMVATSIAAMADATVVEQRGLLASTIVNTLMADNWTVTVVDGGDPDRYTGIEATRGTEHLIAAVGPDELTVDQVGAHDCGGTVDVLVEGLLEIGCALMIADDTPHKGSGGPVYALEGGPTLAHATPLSVRHEVPAAGLGAGTGPA